MLLILFFVSLLISTDWLILFELAFSTLQTHNLVKHDSCSSVELDKLSEQEVKTNFMS